MKIILLILGILLLAFGGGCTLILLMGIVTDANSAFSDMALLLMIWLPLGMLPLLLGYALFRAGSSPRNKPNTSDPSVTKNSSGSQP